MKVSLKWLKDYIDVGISIDDFSHKMTMAGLEVEAIESVKGDKVIELEITPNRADCLNVLGLARESSAILNKNLKAPKISKLKTPKAKTNLAIENKQDCPRYIGTIIENVKVSSSPKWLKERIEVIGTRPVNNVVDITNFCLMELGQPLHAFDYDQLEGGKIVVRRAKKGETIVTIDGEKRKLDPSILVIADAKRPVAIAGVMGGQATEVTSKTKNILLESASFDPPLIRRASRSLGLSSDSSYRFERGIDIGLVERCTYRAVSLIQELAGGNITNYKDLFLLKSKQKQPSISISMDQINSLLGANIPLSRCQTILKKLDFKVTGGKKNSLTATPPSFRQDIRIKEDIIEEVSRVIGYDNLPSSFPNIPSVNIDSNNNKANKDRARDLLTAQGFNEIITYTMVGRKVLEKTNLNINTTTLAIQNPLTQDQEIMRPHLLPSFLSVVLTNINRGQRDLRLFEVGKIYTNKGEKDILGLLMTGPRSNDWRNPSKEQADFYDLKGAVEEFLKNLHIKTSSFVALENASIFERGHAATIQVGNKSIGEIGQLQRSTLNAWDIKRDKIYFATLDLEWVLNNMGTQKKFASVPEYPAILRDVSLAIPNDVTFDQIKEVIHKQKPKFLQSISFIEEYLGEKLPEGHKGLVFSLTYQSLEQTLRDEEVSEIHAQVSQALISQLKAIQR